MVIQRFIKSLVIGGIVIFSLLLTYVFIDETHQIKKSICDTIENKLGNSIALKSDFFRYKNVSPGEEEIYAEFTITSSENNKLDFGENVLIRESDIPIFRNNRAVRKRISKMLNNNQLFGIITIYGDDACKELILVDSENNKLYYIYYDYL